MPQMDSLTTAVEEDGIDGKHPHLHAAVGETLELDSAHKLEQLGHPVGGYQFDTLQPLLHDLDLLDWIKA